VAEPEGRCNAVLSSWGVVCEEPAINHAGSHHARQSPEENPIHWCSCQGCAPHARHQAGECFSKGCTCKREFWEKGRCARAIREAGWPYPPRSEATRDDGAVLKETPAGFVDNEPMAPAVALDRIEAELGTLRARLATYARLVRACEFAALAKLAMEEP